MRSSRCAFAREYSDCFNRSFGGAQVSRILPRGQTGQQLLLGAYQAGGKLQLVVLRCMNTELLISSN
jgi:hypothetical protein